MRDVPEGHPESVEDGVKTTGTVGTELSMLEIQNLNEVPESLYKYSIRAAVFMAAQSITLFYLAAKSSAKWYLYTNYPQPEDDALSRPPSGPDPQQIGGFSILWYSPIFIGMASMEHFCCLVFKKHYEYYIARNQNPFRWLEYTFSASLMRIMVAQLAGVTDVHMILVIYILAALTMQTGSAHEVFNCKARADGNYQNWYCYWLSYVSHMTTWLIIMNYFVMRLQHGSDMPGFVWGIVISQFFLDASFAVVFTLQWMSIPPFDGTYKREYGE